MLINNFSIGNRRTFELIVDRWRKLEWRHAKTSFAIFFHICNTLFIIWRIGTIRSPFSRTYSFEDAFCNSVAKFDVSVRSLTYPRAVKTCIFVRSRPYDDPRRSWIVFVDLCFWTSSSFTTEKPAVIKVSYLQSRVGEFRFRTRFSDLTRLM